MSFRPKELISVTTYFYTAETLNNLQITDYYTHDIHINYLWPRTAR